MQQENLGSDEPWQATRRKNVYIKDLRHLRYGVCVTLNRFRADVAYSRLNFRWNVDIFSNQETNAPCSKYGLHEDPQHRLTAPELNTIVYPQTTPSPRYSAEQTQAKKVI